MAQLKWFLVFMIIWACACALADYVYIFESRVWCMTWGYLSGAIAADFANKIANQKAATKG